ncbi:hypothetical protein [Streptomyces sp. NPDC051677]|uniref:hypothetical protein n=1 Tax=Streptomyces sp. NPDC051677 TaxID=3365669 RepID=UPI0037D1043B
MFGFDTASTLAEESVDPRRNAPRSVIASLVAAFVGGAIFIAAMPAAIPGPISRAVSSGGLPSVDIISANFSNTGVDVRPGRRSEAALAFCSQEQPSPPRRWRR